MATGVSAEARATAGRFYTVVKSLNNFDKLEVKGVIDTLLSRTDEESCFVGTYYRTSGNIESVLELKHPKHFQAAAMLARGLFELAVDMRLLEVIQNGWNKMIAFADVEKLRCARKAVAFKTVNPTANVDVNADDSFIANRAHEIERQHRILWPNKEGVRHWSGHSLNVRVKLLKAPFEQIYEVEYPGLSWYVHAGLTGVINLEAVTFTYICSNAFKLAADSYWEVLRVVIRKFKIAKANEKIETKLDVAKTLPFTDNPEQVDRLMKSIE